MLVKIFNIYKFYFLISAFVALLLAIAYYPLSILGYFLIFLGAFLSPFLYEIDYFVYAYILDPDSPFSITLRNLILAKNYKGAFIFAHENNKDMSYSVLRSILVVLGVLGIAFILILSPNTSLFSIGIVLSFLLTSIYLQVVSLYTNSWKMWYSSFEIPIDKKYAQLIIGAQLVIFIFFILQIL